MFNWVLNTPLNFDLLYLLLVDIWKWSVCLVPWEKFFSLSLMQFRSIHDFLSDDGSQIESKKQAQWFSNILMCDIRYLDNCPWRKVSPVGVKVRVSFRIRGGQFSTGKIVPEPQNSLFKIGEIVSNFLYYNKFIRSWANMFNEAYWTYSLMTGTYQWTLKRQTRIFVDIWSL